MPTLTVKSPSITLAQLGPRICIIGPSNSGKSTLAAAIAQQLALPVVHLDQLYHQPHSNWTPRATDEFITLHDQAIADDQWVMEGNYSICMPQRLARATGLLVLELGTALSLYRYMRRSLFEPDHIGGLAGARDSIKWNMIKHIAITTPKNRKRYQQLYDDWKGPALRIEGSNALHHWYHAWQLSRPSARAQ